MHPLPFELLAHILSYLSPSQCKTARRTCRAFNTVLAKPTFRVLASFTDPSVAQKTLECLAADLSRRPRAIWSPRCTVPAGLVISESFLLALFVALEGYSWIDEIGGCGTQECLEDLRGDNGVLGSVVDIEALKDRLRYRNNLVEDTLCGVMFRYSLYLSYTDCGEGQTSQAWMLNSKHRVPTRHIDHVSCRTFST
ncbi:hypothetical protein S40285_01274 [Stachybotrys chlorohalonatus IBT 40285]|uniref:F-box domain-containing protein n=1 Tax=Stachybotrys chlorohalonatus (strain IBT 40285) TaxID=1283841 RepID=A0A084QQU8_STAC4|nr:hypothetical protein S40285_01274 [Stachybotrys chlorohalonata IBT 40285]